MSLAGNFIFEKSSATVVCCILNFLSKKKKKKTMIKIIIYLVTLYYLLTSYIYYILFIWLIFFGNMWIWFKKKILKKWLYSMRIVWQILKLPHSSFAFLKTFKSRENGKFDFSYSGKTYTMFWILKDISGLIVILWYILNSSIKLAASKYDVQMVYALLIAKTTKGKIRWLHKVTS